MCCDDIRVVVEGRGFDSRVFAISEQAESFVIKSYARVAHAMMSHDNWTVALRMIWPGVKPERSIQAFRWQRQRHVL